MLKIIELLIIFYVVANIVLFIIGIAEALDDLGRTYPRYKRKTSITVEDVIEFILLGGFTSGRILTRYVVKLCRRAKLTVVSDLIRRVLNFEVIKFKEDSK